ncbi:MAG: hypothetical protein ACQEUO_18625 [Bacillota bacterium]
MKGENDKVTLLISIMIFIIAVSLVVLIFDKANEHWNEKKDIRDAERNKEEEMRYQLVTEKLKEPKESVYIEMKDGKYIVNSEKGEYIVVYNGDYSKIEHFVKVGPKKNE